MEYGMFNLVLGLWGVVVFLTAIIEFIQLRGNFFPFTLGGLAGVASYLAGFDIPIQLAAFSLVSAFGFISLRPMFKQIAKQNSSRHLKGMDKLVGKTGTVIRKVEGFSDRGIVDVDGRPCPAIPSDPAQKYNVGDEVHVTAFENGFLVVKKEKKRS